LLKLPLAEQRENLQTAQPRIPQGNRSGGDGVRRIIDEFTDLEISRQRKWQLRRAKEGKCIKCGARAAVSSILCVRHNVKTAVYNHERKYPGKKPLNSKWLKFVGLRAVGKKP
jgi:hypothetical protein